MRSTIMTTVLSTLNKFRDWWLAQKSASVACGSSAQLALRKKLKNIEIDSSFPNVTVVEAYLTPKVDESRDAFTWGYPDAESIREYAKKTFGWTTTKTNEILNPVLKRLDEKKTQATIRNYFTVRSALSVRELKVSKRVQKAIDKMSGKIENDETPAEKKVKRAARKKKNEDPVITEESDGVTTKESTDLVDRENTEKPTTTISNMVSDLVEEEPTTSNLAKRLPRKRPAPNFHNKKDDVIPQREKDKLKMLENKAKAAEILMKQSQPKKKRQ